MVSRDGWRLKILRLFEKGNDVFYQ